MKALYHLLDNDNEKMLQTYDELGLISKQQKLDLLDFIQENNIKAHKIKKYLQIEDEENW